MLSAIAWVIACILFILSGIHIYWLFGGLKGVNAALPVSLTAKSLKPFQLATAIIAILLALAAIVVMLVGNILSINILPNWLIDGIGWGLAIVFLGRTIGDFRWIGVFKKYNTSLFAKWDTRLYSPLCFLISAGVVLLLVA